MAGLFMVLPEKDTNGCERSALDRHDDGRRRSWRSDDLRNPVAAAGIIFCLSPHRAAATMLGRIGRVTIPAKWRIVRQARWSGPMTAATCR